MLGDINKEETPEPITSGAGDQTPTPTQEPQPAIQNQPDQTPAVPQQEPPPSLPENPTPDDVLQQYVAQDKLPPDPDMMDSIKAGKLPLETALNRYESHKNTIPYLTKEGQVVEPNTLSGVQPKLIADDELTFTDKLADSFKKQYEHDADSATYIAKKYANGLSFGVYDPQLQAPDKLTAFAGGMVNLAGWGISSVLGGELIGGAAKAMEGVKGLDLIPKAMSAFERWKEGVNATEATGAVEKIGKFGKQVLGVTPEAATIGAVSEGGKSAIEGNKTSDVIGDALFGALEFSVATPFVMAGMEGAAKMSGGALSKIGQIFRAKASADLAEKAFTYLANADTIEKKISALTDLPQRSEQQDRVLNGLQKIKASQPIAGPFPMDELVKDKKLLADIMGDEAKTTAEKLYTNDDSPLKPVFDSSPELQSMLKNGQYVEALSSAQGFFRDQVKDFNTIGDMTSAPWMQNAKSLSSFVADRVEERISSLQFPNLSRNLIIDYIQNPTKEGLAALREAVPNAYVLRKGLGVAPKKVLAEGEGAFNDVRLSARDVDRHVGNIVKNSLDALNPDGMIDFNSLNKLRDTDSILKSAITFNKYLNDTLLQSFMRPVMSADGADQFVNVPKDMEQHVGSAINVRKLTDQLSNEMQRKTEVQQMIMELKGQIKELPDQPQAQEEGIKTLFGSGSNLTDRAMTAADAEKLQLNLKMWQMEQKQVTGNISRWQRMVTDEGTKLESLSDEDYSRVNDVATQIYRPRVGTTTPDEEVRSKVAKDLMSRMGYRDNPNYIKADSALADFMGALTAAGRDFDIPAKANGFWDSILNRSPLNFSIMNNMSRKIQKEFGFNSPIEQWFGKIRDLEAGKIMQRNKMMNDLEQIGIKAGSKDSAFLHDFAEGNIREYDKEFIDLPAEKQQQMMSARDQLRGTYDNLLDTINAVHLKNNLPAVNKRTDYITHFHEIQNDLPELVERMLNGNNLETPVASGRLYNLSPFKSDPTKPYFGFENHRTGDQDYVKDAIGAFQAYLEPALNRIWYTDTIRQLDAAKAFAPQNMGEFLGKVKNQLLGSGGDSTPAFWKEAASWYQRRMAKGALFANPNLVVQRALSNVLSFTISGRDAASATMAMGSQWAKDWWAKSSSRVTRSAVENVDLDKNLFGDLMNDMRKVAGTLKANGNDWTAAGMEGVAKGLDAAGVPLKAASNFWNKWSSAAFRTFDEMSIQHAFLTGVKHAQRMGITDEAQIVNFADTFSDKLHTSFAKIDKPELYNHWLGRSIGQFQSFAINLGAALMNDLPQVALHDGAAKATTMLLRGYAGITIANTIAEQMGAPTPFRAKSFIPFFDTTQFGVPGIVGGITQTAKELGKADFAGDETKGKYVKNKLIQQGMTLAIPGGSQLYRTGSQLYDSESKFKFSTEKMEKYDTTGEKIKAGIFGSRQANEYQKSKLKREDDYYNEESSIEETEHKIKKSLRGIFKRR